MALSLAGWVFATFLAGCTLSKPPEHAQVVHEALPAGTTIPAAWIASANANDVTGEWLRSFNDPALNAVVSAAIANNLDLSQAAARVEVARQTVVVVGSQLLPQIGAQFGGDFTRLEGQNGINTSDLEYIGVAWEVDIWGRLRAQKAASEAGFEATALDYAFARQSLAATAAMSWYLAIETRQLLAIAAHSVNLYTQLLDLVKVRNAAGKVSDLDIVEASANLDIANSQLRTAEIDCHDAQRNLEVLTGRYPGAELAIADAFPQLPPPVRAGLPSSLLERRPDIIAAERQVLATFRTKEAAKLALLPSIALTLDGAHLSNELFSTLMLNPWLVHGAIGMYVPIYTGGALTAQIKIATAQQQEAVAHYGSVVLTAFNEVEGGLTNQTLLAERLPYQENASTDSVEAVRIGRVQYEAGATDMLSVLQLEERRIANQRELIELRNAQLANRIQLHLALGGSFERQSLETTSSSAFGNSEYQHLP